MEEMNETPKIQFFFHPFSTDPKVQLVISAAFLVMYLTSLSGNATVAVIVQVNHSLHTPMYFFLANLADLEIFYTSSITPLALANLPSMGKTPVSIAGCGTQMFFFVFLGGADCLLLAVMAYDWFVAICYPLCWWMLARLVISSSNTGILHFLKVCVTPLCFYKRPVSAEWKKSKENFCFYKKGWKAKLALSVCFAPSYYTGRVHCKQQERPCQAPSQKHTQHPGIRLSELWIVSMSICAWS